MSVQYVYNWRKELYGSSRKEPVPMASFFSLLLGEPFLNLICPASFWVVQKTPSLWFAVSWHSKKRSAHSKRVKIHLFSHFELMAPTSKMSFFSFDSIARNFEISLHLPARRRLNRKTELYFWEIPNRGTEFYAFTRTQQIYPNQLLLPINCRPKQSSSTKEENYTKLAE